MKNRNIVGILAGVYGAGALTMYFFDSQRGNRRRAELRDAMVHAKRELEKFAVRLGRDAEHRFEGAVSETARLLHREPQSDYVLEQKVHAVLGRVLSHPGAVEVSAKDGVVFLSGWILTEEADELTKALASIEGVKHFTSYLNTTDRPEHIPALQGGIRRKHVPEFLQQRWSPTARLIAGCAGLGLAAYGIRRWKSITNPASIAGTVLLGRSVLNMPWAAVAGLDRTMGIRIQKTIHIAASPAELYRFWDNPENYPQAFPHVREVCRVEGDVYQWELSGPTGAALKWKGSIVRRIPDKLIEWRSLLDSVVENHGIVHFDAEKDGKTRVQIQMSYRPPAGLLGHAFATLLGLDPKRILDEDLIPVKDLFEKGAATVHGQQVTKSQLPSAS